MEKKVVLVTGASSGIGKSIAEKLLLMNEFVVYAAARRIEKMQDLEALGAITVKTDLTKDQDIKNLAQQIANEHIGVDILINNAGFGLYGSVEETSIEDARYQFEVNLFSLARLTQLLIPYMRQKLGGKIINISSIAGVAYMPMGSWYHATKHALEGWSDCLRVELQQFGIDVIIIQPGLINTEFSKIASEGMALRSGTGPYAKMAQATTTMKTKLFRQGKASNPDSISNIVLKALCAEKPKVRYFAGKYAMMTLLMCRFCSYRLFDKMALLLLEKYTK